LAGSEIEHQVRRVASEDGYTFTGHLDLWPMAGF
jgi:hypothetical protein